MSYPSSPLPQTHTATAPSISVSLTYLPLSPSDSITSVRSPNAGATVLFAGTTRADPLPPPSPTTPNLPPTSTIHHLTYTSYIPLALKSLLHIATSTLQLHHLTKINIVHRLGDVPVGEESVLVAVSAPHRKEAWEGAEEALERVKGGVEVWKREGWV